MIKSKVISFVVITSEVARADDCYIFKNHNTIPWREQIGLCLSSTQRSTAQRSTSISVAAPPLYQLAVWRRMAEMTCWWGRVTFVLILSPANGKSLKFVLAFSLHSITACECLGWRGLTFIWVWNRTILTEGLCGIGTEPIKRAGQFSFHPFRFALWRKMTN